MARKPPVAIQETKETNEEFEQYLDEHKHQLICMEVYSEFCGPCLATGNAIRKGKLEIGHDDIAMVKCLADNIDALERFRDRSEPVFLFIVNHKLVRLMFGPNGIELCKIIEEELKKSADENAGIEIDRPRWEIREMLPIEAERQEVLQKIENELKENAERLRVLTLAARKKRVNERLAKIVARLNFIMFWPHCHQAHYDLYEKWDRLNINVAARENFQLDEESAREVLYMSDVDPNEACLHALFAGEVLVVLFKMFDTDTRDFVQLMRYALYEEIPVPKEDVPPEKQLPPIPAYERYATISKSAREVRRDRYNAKLEKLRKEKEEADRLQAEQDRMAREAAEEAARIEKQKAEEARMARIAAGLPADPEPEPEPTAEEGEHKEGEEGAEGEGVEGEAKSVKTETEVSEPATTVTDVTPAEPEHVPPPPPAEGEGVEGGEAPVGEAPPAEEKEEEFDSDKEIEGEDFIPAGGLFVPGLYTPPSDLGKANGLAFFFPKILKTLTEELETEYLPPHILVMFNVDKRYEVQEIVNQYAPEILNMGVFVGDDPYKAEHIAYTIKQYDKIIRPKKYHDRIALMVSRKRSLPLLQLAGLNPVYISSDVVNGEKECLAMFPVGYGDEYFEEESIKEEEVVTVENPVESAHEEVVDTEEKAQDEEDENEA